MVLLELRIGSAKQLAGGVLAPAGEFAVEAHAARVIRGGADLLEDVGQDNETNDLLIVVVRQHNAEFRQRVGEEMPNSGLRRIRVHRSAARGADRGMEVADVRYTQRARLLAGRVWMSRMVMLLMVE
jgi:hypothetical protein